MDFKSPMGWYLNGTVVDTSFRRQGIAKTMAGFRSEYITKNSNSSALYSIVAADNFASIAYHESLGFKEIQRAEGFLKIKLKCGEGILFQKNN